MKQVALYLVDLRFALLAFVTAASSAVHGDLECDGNVTAAGRSVFSAVVAPLTLQNGVPTVHASSCRGCMGRVPLTMSNGSCWLASNRLPLVALPVIGDATINHQARRSERSSPTERTSTISPEVQKLLDYGRQIARARSSAEVRTRFSDQPWNTSFLPGMRLGKDAWDGLGLQIRGFPSMVEFETNIGSEPSVLRLTCGYDWFRATISVVTATDMEDGVTHRLLSGARNPVFSTGRPSWDDGAYTECVTLGLCVADSASEAATSLLLVCLRLGEPLPVSQSEWGTAASPNVSLDCGNKGSAIHRYASVQDGKAREDLEQCRMKCSRNKSCLAFASVDVGAGNRCIIWTIRNDNLFLRPPRTDSASAQLRYTSSWEIFAIASIASIVWLILSAVYFLLKIKMDNWRAGTSGPENFSTDVAVNLPQDNTVSTTAPIDLATLERATNHFSKKNIIGEGGFAIVYKGRLPKNHALARGLDQRKIAVKRLKPSALSAKGLNDFRREVEMMSRLRHDNLVRLLAYCADDNDRILVYEYMPKKSLYGYIFGTRKVRASLNWARRLEIIHGMAEGVSYLHEGSGQVVIHRDLKPSNVLLDDKWTTKIADFGATKLLAANDTGTQTIVFSPGYAAPEYMRGDVTLKCDVYSFGVVMLEIISGQKNTTVPSLLSRAWRLWDEHRIMDLLDSSMAKRNSEKPELLSRVRKCIQVGLLCVQECPADRPTMSEVSEMLIGDGTLLNKPKMPSVFDKSE